MITQTNTVQSDVDDSPFPFDYESEPEWDDREDYDEYDPDWIVFDWEL
jgi:hypothetical protein